MASESVALELVGLVLVSDAGPWHRGSPGLECREQNGSAMLAECWKGKGVYGMRGMQGRFCPLPVPRHGPTPHCHHTLCPILCLLPALLLGCDRNGMPSPRRYQGP